MFNSLINNSLAIWNIGFVDPEAIFMDGKLAVKWMKHSYRDRWFADPFVLSADNKEIKLLVEEYKIDSCKGNIALLTVDRKTCELKGRKNVLDLDTHLSFPYIWDFQGKTYIIPENCKSGSVALYQYDRENDTISFLHVICEQPLVDSIILPLYGRLYLVGKFENDDYLRFYEFDTNTLTCTNEAWHIPDAKNTLRNGGDCIMRDGQIYLVSQDCEKCYGHGVIINKVIPGEKSEDLKMVPVARHYPGKLKYHIGLHTYNSCDYIGVIDGKGYASALLSLILPLIPQKSLKKIISKIYIRHS